MESTTTIGNVRDDLLTKQKFDSFKFGGAGSLPSNVVPKHSHSRSHSRNHSVSLSSISLSASKPSALSDMSLSSVPANPPPTHPSTPSSTPSPSNPVPSNKRNSHHRRRSSMSTRHESAEIMGLSIPDIPCSTSDDNFNLGDKDSIRRRALMALEGKPDMAFSKVEIPELSAPGIEKLMFDFSTSKSLSTISSGSYGNSLNSLVSNKRDSFKLLAASSSSKDQLHTLVEEEEEEEETEEQECSQQQSESIFQEEVSFNSVPPVAKPTASRRRPATLSLKPLSLVAEIAATSFYTQAPSSNARPGLRSLSLSATSPTDSATDDRGHSLSLASSPQSKPSHIFSDIGSPREAVEDGKPRRSSISYRPSHGTGVTTNLAGLPTPDMTPTSFGRRCSLASTASGSQGGQDDDFFPAPPNSTPSFSSHSRPLSVSEQHFLVKSHHALLARITDLERALSIRRWQDNGYARQTPGSSSGGSRPVSMSSEASSPANNADVDDEMLRLIADLKAERDELKRDVEGWRTRVANLETQLGMVTKRLDVERRDTWVARSRVGLLEAEKADLEKRVGALDQKILSFETESERFAADQTQLQTQLSQADEHVVQLESELDKVKQELEEERRLRLQQEQQLKEALEKLEIQNRSSHAFAMDSECSIAAEGPAFDGTTSGEESEDDPSEQESDVVSDEDSDTNFTGPLHSDSFGSEEEFPQSVEGHLCDMPSSVMPTSGSGTPTISRSRSQSPEPVTPAQEHVLMPATPQGDNMRSWSFASATRLPSADSTSMQNDRFFGCFDDVEDDSAPSVPYEYEESKGLFARGLSVGSEDEDSPFFFPSGSAVVEIQQQGIHELFENKLEAVLEEEEDEEKQYNEKEDMFGDAGGITITFTPADADAAIEHRSLSSENHEALVMAVPTIHVSMDGEEERSQCPAVPAATVTDEPAPSVSRVQATAAVDANGATSVADGHSWKQSSTLAKSRSSPSTPPSAIPRASPSSIPRFKSTLRPPSSSTATIPTKVPVAKSAPLSRRGAVPSFIPQPVNSPPRSQRSKPRQPSIPYTNLHQQTRPLILSKGSVTGVTANGSTQPVIPYQGNVSMNECSSRRFPTKVCVAEAHPDGPTTATTSRVRYLPPKHWRSQTPTGSVLTSIDLSSDNLNDEYPLHDQDAARYPTPATSSLTSHSSSPPTPFTSRLSLQSLTNFIPSIPWPASATATAGPVEATTASIPSSSPLVIEQRQPSALPSILLSQLMVSQRLSYKAKQPGFVSREQQLAKLRLRLQQERGIGMQVGMGLCVDVCKKCTAVNHKSVSL